MEAHAEQSRLEEVTEAAVRIALHVQEALEVISQIEEVRRRAALASHHARLFADRIRVREK